MLSQKVISHNLIETQKYAQSLTKIFQVNESVGFIGDLGAGKTTLIQYLLKELGYQHYVSSPSYALVNEYDLTPPIVHIDLYRLKENSDWQEIGIDYYLNSQKICFIEWPQRLPNEFQLDYTLTIDKINKSSRSFVLTKN